MDLDSYARLDAVAIADGVRSGRLDPVEVVEAALASVLAIDPLINAVVHIDVPRARAAARRIDRGRPLAGVPVLSKDNNLYVDGWPTSFGSRFLTGAPIGPQSAVVDRLEAAGAVLIGKTSLPELAADWTTEPSLNGPTCNPWSLAHSPGGSSGGSAAAVAAGLVPLAHGNDSAGSLRVPAAVCGVVGLKPTRGLVPVGPAFPELAAGLDSEFVLARSVRDSALCLDVLAGPEPGGQYRVERAVPSYLAALATPPGPLAVGVVTRRPDGSSVDPEIEAAVGRVADILGRLGHRLVPMPMPHDPGLGLAAEIVGFTEMAMLVTREANRRGRDPRSDEIEALTALALVRSRALGAIDYLEARHELHRIAVELLGVMADCDVLLTPTTGTPAPRIGEIDSRTERFDYDRLAQQSARFAPFTDVFNATGQPALSLPAGLTREGLPIGVQIAGAPGRDDLVLGLAASLERDLALPPEQRTPRSPAQA